MASVQVFVTIALYQAIRIPITVFMPFAVQNMAEMRVCFDRLQVRADIDSSDSCSSAYRVCVCGFGFVFFVAFDSFFHFV